MKVQVKNGHYDFSKYVALNRWDSYYYQLENALTPNINSILLIGIGDNIVPSILKQFGKKVTLFDFDSKLNPDIEGSVLEINKLVKEKYDLIICCQVLEHMPFSNFEKTIKKFSKISNKVILSLPYCNSNILTSKIKLPKIKTIKIKLLIPKILLKGFRLEKEGNHEHYWEVGIKNSRKKDIRNILKKYYKIKKEFNPIENTYHIFYILEKENKNEKN